MAFTFVFTKKFIEQHPPLHAMMALARIVSNLGDDNIEITSVEEVIPDPNIGFIGNKVALHEGQVTIKYRIKPTI